MNGLLESNEWEVGDTVDQIKARIVVVGDQTGLTPDVRSRLCRHMDAASVKLASLPKEKVKPEQQPYCNSLEQIAKITIESDVESLLNEHYLTAREYANAHNGNKTLEVIDRPLLVASLEELTTLQQHFKIKLPVRLCQHNLLLSTRRRCRVDMTLMLSF